MSDDYLQLLAAQHRREGFDCGDAALNDFLRRQTGQQQRRGFGKTYIALAEDGETVLGFVTVSAGQIATTSLPDQLKSPRYPAPMLRIGRMAVDMPFVVVAHFNRNYSRFPRKRTANLFST